MNYTWWQIESLPFKDSDGELSLLIGCDCVLDLKLGGRKPTYVVRLLLVWVAFKPSSYSICEASSINSISTNIFGMIEKTRKDVWHIFGTCSLWTKVCCEYTQHSGIVHTVHRWSFCSSLSWMEDAITGLGNHASILAQRKLLTISWWLTKSMEKGIRERYVTVVPEKQLEIM